VRRWSNGKQAVFRRIAWPRTGLSVPPSRRTPVGHVRIVVLGRSVRGREILARVVGDPGASRNILVVGCVQRDSE
jgi:hypothetical protein